MFGTERDYSGSDGSVIQAQFIANPAAIPPGVKSPLVFLNHTSRLTVKFPAGEHTVNVSNPKVELDGVPVRQLRRLKSEVFEIALPESNVFDPLCSPLNVPAGIFSPAVDDGYYVTLDPLKKGPHTLHIHAENSGQGFLLDVTFNLNVIPVLNK